MAHQNDTSSWHAQSQANALIARSSLEENELGGVDPADVIEKLDEFGMLRGLTEQEYHQLKNQR